MSTILIIEDDKAISELIVMNLKMYGFSIQTAFDGIKGLEMLAHHKPDLILLDIMLPGLDGYDLLPKIKALKIPVIILSAKNSLQSKLTGFNLGADDYMTKPFEALELIARINAVLNRSETKIRDFNEIQLINEITLCGESRLVHQSKETIELTPKEFDLLYYLVTNQGIALSRENLLDKIWEYSFAGNTRTVDMHVQKLRNKLGSNIIETVYKYGYRYDG